MRTLPLVPASVDAKLVSKPETFSGKDAEWPRWSLTLRGKQSVDRVYLEPGDDVLDAQLYFTLLVIDFPSKICQSESGVCSMAFLISRSVQVVIRGKESIVWKNASNRTKQPPRRTWTMTRGQEFS